jgi:hypothetical protein
MGIFLSVGRARAAKSSHFWAKCGLAAAVALVLSGPLAQQASATTPNYPPPSVCSVSALSNGSAAIVRGTGFLGNSAVVLSSAGSSQTVTANATGSFATSMAASLGANIVATGQGCVADDVVEQAPSDPVAVTPTSTSGLAFTGVQVGGLLAIGLAFIVVGGFAVRGARKSSHA